MRVIFTGKGTSGSWIIRGEQIAEGMRELGVDAQAVPKASAKELRYADVVVLVKRPTFELLREIRQSGKPFAWDIVDSWPQPIGNEWDETAAKTWLLTSINDVRPDLLMCATRAMMEDAKFPRACVIYHHARPGYVTIGKHPPCRSKKFLLVGYEGGQNYLGRYREMVESECRKRRLHFDHKSIRCADVALCLRDCAGYAPKHWKSQVKSENARALGIPSLCSPESGYRETSRGGIIWIQSPSDIPSAFDVLSDPEGYAQLRSEVSAPITLEQVAREYLIELGRIC